LANDSAAWQELCDRYRPALAGFVRKLLRRRALDPAWAEDIVQDLFVALSQRGTKCLGPFNAGQRPLLIYLCVLARRQAKWVLRRTGRQRGNAVGLGNLDPPDPAAADGCLEARLHEFSQSLPPREQQCFEEEFLGNGPQSARRTAKSPAARKRAERVRAKGRKFFEEP
jgi:DNA-directed RNA polymerase specialized sigma24 family protein